VGFDGLPHSHGDIVWDDEGVMRAHTVPPLLWPRLVSLTMATFFVVQTDRLCSRVLGCGAIPPVVASVLVVSQPGCVADVSWPCRMVTSLACLPHNALRAPLRTTTTHPHVVAHHCPRTAHARFLSRAWGICVSTLTQQLSVASLRRLTHPRSPCACSPQTCRWRAGSSRRARSTASTRMGASWPSSTRTVRDATFTSLTHPLLTHHRLSQ
jgi:hypothetical protein